MTKRNSSAPHLDRYRVLEVHRTDRRPVVRQNRPVSDRHRQGIAADAPSGLLLSWSKDALLTPIDTFFEGSTEKVVAALLGGYGARLSEQELDRIVDLVTKVRKEGSK
jgi:hypothetical protein